MNIVFLTRRFFPEVGGVETHVAKISKILSARGHTISIITTKPATNAQNRDLSTKNVSVIHTDVGKNDWFLKFRVWKEMLRTRSIWSKADIIHAHDVFFWIQPFLWLRPLNIYTTFHGYETVFPPAQKAIAARKAAQKKSKGTINVGEYIKKWYGTKADFVVYGGVEQVESQKLKVKSWGSRIRIIFVGRVEEDNGVGVYSEVLRMLFEKGVVFEFVALGDGSMRTEFEKYGEVRGFVKDLKTAIDGADIVFASSYLSILEALSYGKPVFSVYQNELKKDYLRMTPFAKWIEVDSNPKKIAEKIELLVSGKVKSNAEDAKVWLEKNTWEDVTNIYEKLWQKK